MCYTENFSPSEFWLIVFKDTSSRTMNNSACVLKSITQLAPPCLGSSEQFDVVFFPNRQHYLLPEGRAIGLSLPRALSTPLTARHIQMRSAKPLLWDAASKHTPLWCCTSSYNTAMVISHSNTWVLSLGLRTRIIMKSPLVVEVLKTKFT